MQIPTRNDKYMYTNAICTVRLAERGAGWKLTVISFYHVSMG